MDSERLLKWMRKNSATLRVEYTGYANARGASIKMSIVKNDKIYSAEHVLSEGEIVSMRMPAMTDAVESIIELLDNLPKG